MTDRFSIDGNYRFARTQPREWRDIPFDNGPHKLRLVFQIIGIILFWIAVAGLSLWSISQQNIPANTHIIKEGKHA